MATPNEITFGPHKGAFLGEQAIGFFKGSEGFFFVDGPSGGGGHGLTAPGFDGVAFHPQTKELIIYDNKAYKRAGNVASATAIDPERNLLKNLEDLIEHVETNPKLKGFMPNRPEILSQLKRSRDAVKSWIAAGKPAGGLKLPGKTKLVVYNAWGNSTGIGAKLAKSGAIEFIDVAQAPAPKLTAVTEMTLDQLKKDTEKAGEQAAELVERRILNQAEKVAAEEATRTALKRAGFGKTVGSTIKRLVASKAAKRTLALLPVIGWGFSAKDAYAGVKDIMAGHVYRGLGGIGLAAADVAADFLHLGDLVTGVGGTALSLGVQAGTSAGQIAIEMERVEEKMQELQAEIARTGVLPSDARLEDYYDLDEDAIRDLKASLTAETPLPGTAANPTRPLQAASAAPGAKVQDAIPISPPAQALLGAIGTPGSRKPWKEARQLSGLVPSTSYDAIQELEKKGYVKVERLGGDELNITGVTRIK